MYNVIVADDERIIREGISKLVKWEEMDLNLIDTAENGIDAYEKIQKYHPDIMITDIKMPGLNGLDLIEKVNKDQYKIKFIILSGYNEFNLAKKAMMFGVKHYLLKPTNEEEIMKVLNEVIEEIKIEENKNQFMDSIKNDLLTAIPLAREQFIRDRALNKIFSSEEINHYKKMFNIENYELQIVLFEFEEEWKIEIMYALEKIVKNNFSKDDFFFNTFIKNSLLILIRSTGLNELIEKIKTIKETFSQYYKKYITVAISSKNVFDKLHLLYQEAHQLTRYKFFLGEDCIITKDDVKDDRKYSDINNNYYLIEQIVTSVKCGDVESVKSEIGNFIKQMKDEKYEEDLILSSAMELMLSVIRNNLDNIKNIMNKNVNEYFELILSIKKIKTIDEIEKYIKDIAIGITESNFNALTHKKNRLVEMLLKKVEENLDNENLSLKWLSKNMVFANVDYLSKLFKKEMNMNFSQYVIQQRMEKAKILLSDLSTDKIYEIALKVGFGYNSQYFSQVFKSYTGLSPSEYKNTLEENMSSLRRY
jgi:two-component system, response regulator YesN